MEIAVEQILILFFTGLAAGVINTLAAGGSNLTLPALMIMGMPADIANGTNRVGIVLQSVVSTLGFRKHKKIPTNDLGPILLPTIVGGLLGAVAASFAPPAMLKPLLLISMISMALVILIFPKVIIPPSDTTPFLMKERPWAWLWIGLAGFYGGFVQAGVGFILITALAGSLRYDLVRTNALKIICTLVFTVVALAIFIWQDQVLWVPGLLLACGTMLGAHLAVKFAINADPALLKWFIFAMTICGSAAAMWF